MQACTFGDLNHGRRNNYDCLRLLLAVLVIFSHSFPLLEGDNARETFMRITGGQITGGELAVNGFFVMSGFLITQSWEKSRSLASYLKKRALRIYPGFLAAAGFSALVVGPLIASSPSSYWGQFAPLRFVASCLNFQLRLPDVFTDLPVPSVNGSLWSIRYECCCYLGVALLGLSPALMRGPCLVGGFVLSMALYGAQLYFGLKLPGSRFSFLYCYPDFWPRLATSFLAGALFYRYRDRIEYSPRLFALALAGVVFFAATPQVKALPLALPLFGTYLLFYVAYLPVPWLRGVASRGDFSYGMYLYAFPVQQMVVRWYHPWMTPFTLCLVALPVTLVLAVLSWHFVERPFLAGRRTSPAAAPEARPPSLGPKPLAALGAAE